MAWLDTKRQPVCQDRTAKICAKPKRPVFVTGVLHYVHEIAKLSAFVKASPWLKSHSQAGLAAKMLLQAIFPDSLLADSSNHIAPYSSRYLFLTERCKNQSINQSSLVYGYPISIC
jgi:hypothetical protein